MEVDSGVVRSVKLHLSGYEFKHILKGGYVKGKLPDETEVEVKLSQEGFDECYALQQFMLKKENPPAEKDKCTCKKSECYYCVAKCMRVI